MRKKDIKPVKENENVLPELKRNPVKVGRLFEQVPIISDSVDEGYPIEEFGDIYNDVFRNVKANNEKSGTPVPFPDNATCPALITNSFVTAYDMGSAVRIVGENNDMNSPLFKSMCNDITYTAIDGILGEIASKIDMMIFEAYKVLMVKASDYIYTTARGALYAIGNKDDEDYRAVADSLIAQTCETLDKYVQDNARMLSQFHIEHMYYPQYRIKRSTPGDIIINMLAREYNIETKAITSSDKREYIDKVKIVESVTTIGISLPASMTSAAYNSIYYAIAASFGDMSKDLTLMAAMDALGFFTEYHEKLTSIIEYAEVMIGDYIENGVLNIDDKDREEYEECEWYY